MVALFLFYAPAHSYRRKHIIIMVPAYKIRTGQSFTIYPTNAIIRRMSTVQIVSNAVNVLHAWTIRLKSTDDGASVSYSASL